MNGGNIVGCASTGASGGGVYTTGSFTMNGGSIIACLATVMGGGVFVGPNGSFTMTDGEITQCFSCSIGAGIAGEAQSGTSTIALQGGTISYNKAISEVSVACGGGVCAGKGCLVNVEEKANKESETKITNNTATAPSSAMGGGIAAMPGSTINVKGGTISDNTASSKGSAMGGGIALQGDNTTVATVNITGGTISGNSASLYGGGVSNYQGSKVGSISL